MPRRHDIEHRAEYFSRLQLPIFDDSIGLRRAHRVARHASIVFEFAANHGDECTRNGVRGVSETAHAWSRLVGAGKALPLKDDES